VFKRWKKEVETQTCLKIKSLKSDNGGEYDSSQFKEFCSKNGIRMIKTVPRTPEQNGVTERMNRTLNESKMYENPVRITQGILGRRNKHNSLSHKQRTISSFRLLVT